MGTHPIFESDFDCLTANKTMDPELEALRRARMAQMQGGGGEQAQQKAAQMEEMTNNMLGQILDQSARARLNNIAMVDAGKAKKIPAEKKSDLKFERRRIMDSDDSDSD